MRVCVQGTLACLAVFVNLETFHRTSPVAHLLPERRYFLSHPLDYLSQYLTVYKMHVNQRSQATQAQRDRKMDDLQKRDRYRKAHGIEDTQYVFGFGRRLQKVEKREGEGEEERWGGKEQWYIHTSLSLPLSRSTYTRDTRLGTQASSDRGI